MDTSKRSDKTPMTFDMVRWKGALMLEVQEQNTTFHSSRARNNFRIVSGHDDRSNSFLLGHVSFLAGQMYMVNYSFRGP